MVQLRTYWSDQVFLALLSLLLTIPLEVEADPLPCYHYGADDPIPEGWGVPWNVLSLDQEVLIKVLGDTYSTQVKVGDNSHLQ